MSNGSNFTEKLLRFFELHGVKKVFQKGAFLTREGDIEKKLYLVESGAVRVFYLSEFEEHIVRFGYEGSVINSLSSFITQKPSEFFIEAIRKTTVKIISREELINLRNESDENLRQYIELLEGLVTQQIDREIDLLITSPTERLKRVLNRSPGLFQHVPLKYIASYLRMKPETLSRIRNS